jgi:hypothetical protein
MTWKLRVFALQWQNRKMGSGFREVKPPVPPGAILAARMHEGFSQCGALVRHEGHGVGEIILAHGGWKIGE